jgi:hypothetical protein
MVGACASASERDGTLAHRSALIDAILAMEAARA